MMKKWRRRLRSFFGSTSDLPELDKSSNGVHLISASNVHSRLPPTNIQNASCFAGNRNPQNLHFKDLDCRSRIPGDYSYLNGVGHHPNGIMAKSVPNGLNKQPMYMSSMGPKYNNGALNYRHNYGYNQPIQQYYIGNRCPPHSSSRPSSVYSLYGSNMQVASLFK